ncbi:MAG: hypothetical protein U5L45_04100 [Saprospiraceae bacterium]|nr:hypothetical protein [Saprospiraceae bacterium]
MVGDVVRFSGNALKTNNLPIFASEASARRECKGVLLYVSKFYCMISK